jgi:hypothetical protein
MKALPASILHFFIATGILFRSKFLLLEGAGLILHRESLLERQTLK